MDFAFGWPSILPKQNPYFLFLPSVCSSRKPFHLTPKTWEVILPPLFSLKPHVQHISKSCCFHFQNVCRTGPVTPPLFPPKSKAPPPLPGSLPPCSPPGGAFNIAAHKAAGVIRFHLNHVSPLLKTSQGLEDQHLVPVLPLTSRVSSFRTPAEWTVPPKPPPGPAPLHRVCFNAA